MLGRLMALSSCDGLISVAKTLSNSSASLPAICPFPVPQSHAVAKPLPIRRRYAKSASGYVGRKVAYLSDCVEKLSFIIVGTVPAFTFVKNATKTCCGKIKNILFVTASPWPLPITQLFLLKRNNSMLRSETNKHNGEKNKLSLIAN